MRFAAVALPVAASDQGLDGGDDDRKESYRREPDKVLGLIDFAGKGMLNRQPSAMASGPLSALRAVSVPRTKLGTINGCLDKPSQGNFWEMTPQVLIPPPQNNRGEPQPAASLRNQEPVNPNAPTLRPGRRCFRSSCSPTPPKPRLPSS